MKKILLCAIVFALFSFTANISAEEYDLARYLALVERNNPDLLVMFKDIELAKTDVALARSMFLPRAGVQSGYNRNLIDRTQSMAVASQPGGGQLIFQDVRTNYDNELTLGVGVSQMLYSAGAISNFNKAKLAQAIREQSYEAARLSVLTAAKKLYHRAQLALLVVEIRENSERFSLEQYQRVQRRYQAGASAEMELLSAEVNWMTKADAVVEAKRNTQLVLLAFCDLAGIPHSQEIILTEEHTDYPEISQTPEMSAIIANRADYNALLLSRELADLDRKAATSAFLPEVSASFNYALGTMGNSSSFIGDYNFNSASFGITVNIPILTGGARIARIRAAALAQERTNLNIARKEAAIENEIYELQIRLEEGMRRLESSYRTVEAARRAVASAQNALTNGQATYLNVMDAQDRLDMVWLNFVNVNFEVLSAYYDWELAVGLR
ncbi:MAG: TolC family protein [Treponema sp.]|nr:TolC family protein [Treponema sp.]